MVKELSNNLNHPNRVIQTGFGFYPSAFKHWDTDL